MQLTNLTNWLLFSFFVVGALGGVVYFIRLMFWKEARTEVRYIQIPVYYGYDPAGARSDQTIYHEGRSGDMAQAAEPTSAA